MPTPSPPHRGACPAQSAAPSERRDTALDQALLYFADLRLRVRGNPEARAIVDRCLRLLTEARDADPATLARLQAEVEALRAELVRRLGPPRRLKVH